MAAMLQRYNGTLQQVAESEGSLFIDLASLVPTDLTTLYDDIHFNEKGAERVARVIAEALLASGFPGTISSD
jgi:lysophospholipase L1-like esterase